jgi:hypothetical protein
LKVTELVDDALKYLDTRTEFWRQQQPTYSRKKQQTITIQPTPKKVSQQKKQIVYVPSPKAVIIPTDGKTKLDRFVDTTSQLIHGRILE